MRTPARWRSPRTSSTPAELAQLIRRHTGHEPLVVHSDEKESSRIIETFRRGRQHWLVSVNMVSEGVDIPRLRVGVYATPTTAPLFFRQMCGRLVRTTPGLPADPSYLYLPADPALRDLAAGVEHEMRLPLIPSTEREQDTPSAAEREEPNSFIPLATRVEPTQTVMSGLRFSDPGQAAAIEAFAREFHVPARHILERMEIAEPAPAVAAEETAFEERERLRKKRDRLVRVHVARARERGEDIEHRDVNQRLNEVVACARPVSEHTVAELRAAVRLLSREMAT